jgi:hypothetical protein
MFVQAPDRDRVLWIGKWTFTKCVQLRFNFEISNDQRSSSTTSCHRPYATYAVPQKSALLNGYHDEVRLST